MKTPALIIVCLPLLSGCALFDAERQALAPELRQPANAARVIAPEPTPTLRRASMGPRGLVPCDAAAGITSACRWQGDLHVDAELQLMPTEAAYTPADE